MTQELLVEEYAEHQLWGYYPVDGFDILPSGHGLR